MEIRPLRTDEIDRFVELGHYAFNGRPPEHRTLDFERRIDPQRHVLVIADGPEIISQVAIYPFNLWFDGVRFPAGGLANVATVPERARRGYASQLLRAAIEWMREELQFCVSTLYPTVYPLYNQLGWELAEAAQRLVGAPPAFRPSTLLPADPGGRVVRRISTLDDVALLEPLYRRFAEPRSGYLDRPRWYWEDMVLRHSNAAQPRYVALWYDGSGQLGGYALYAAEQAPERRLRIYEVVSLHPTGYHALLSFFAAHHLYQEVELTAGRDVAWEAMVADPHQLRVDRRLRGHFLLRIVDVTRVISRRAVKSPGGISDLRLAISDPSAPWNEGVWEIGQRDGHWTCEPSGRGEADATLDIRTFAALFAGAISVRQAIDLGRLLATSTARSTLDALFSTSYPPHSNDHF
ncbi:MAG TPA: GNAT family N-acetyltransferase [Chloroflexota bacterium]|nr:GNAT family N-acetyltransferase [Chloroflexota bacterium]